MPYVSRHWGFVESPSITTNSHAISGEYMGVDHSRLVAYYVDASMSTGEFVLKWDGSASSPINFVTMPSNMAAITTCAWNSTADEILIAEEGQGGGTQKWLRADATDGSVITTGTYTYPDTDGQSIIGRGRFTYDPLLDCWWGVAIGGSNGNIYLAKLTATGLSPTVGSLGVALGTTQVNRAPLIDNAGTVWIVTQSYVVKCHTSSPATFAHSATLDQEAAFIWRDRNEIWIPRSSGHGTSGFRVFDIDAETFSNSVDLGLGSWTTLGVSGTVNTQGRAWLFSKVVLNQVDGTLRTTSGTQTRSFTNLWSEPATIENLQYVTGKIFVHNNLLRSVIE